MENVIFYEKLLSISLLYIVSSLEKFLCNWLCWNIFVIWFSLWNVLINIDSFSIILWVMWHLGNLFSLKIPEFNPFYLNLWFIVLLWTAKLKYVCTWLENSMLKIMIQFFWFFMWKLYCVPKDNKIVLKSFKCSEISFFLFFVLAMFYWLNVCIWYDCLEL